MGKKEHQDPRCTMVNEWGDIGLIFSWEATYAGYKGLELKAGSQPTVIRAAKISIFFFFFLRESIYIQGFQNNKLSRIPCSRSSSKRDDPKHQVKHLNQKQIKEPAFCELS